MNIVGGALDWMRSNPVELVATLFGIVTVWLSARENVWSWPTALVQVALSGWVCLALHLYSDVGLQGFYFVTSLYGWYAWTRKKPNEEPALVPRRAPARVLAITLIVGIAGLLTLGTIANRIPGAANPYLDATLSSFSVVAQWLMARKYIENWLLWILLDVAYVPLWWWKSALGFAFLYVVFLGLSIDGFVSWRRKMLTA